MLLEMFLLSSLLWLILSIEVLMLVSIILLVGLIRCENCWVRLLVLLVMLSMWFLLCMLDSLMVKCFYR